MEINTKKIKNKILGPERDKSKANINVSRDWILLLSIFMVVLLIVFVLGIYILLETNNSVQIFTETENHIETINRSELQGMLDEYGTKENLFKELSSKRTYFVDPSL